MVELGSGAVLTLSLPWEGNDILGESTGSEPEGLPESSRGSNPDVSGAAPRNRSIENSHPEGVPASVTLSGSKIQLPSDPGVSLRSTPGYYLAALRAASVLS